ncbi:MAG: sugar phosphate isomerase/epimerase, partial [Clostridia bacterium]|nr:sugar phosphate isomerase/epimerase [Clostridia bacterium]
MAFTITGFTDEINKDFGIQMEGAKKYGLTHIEMRGINGISVGDYDKESIKPIKKQLDENGIKVSAIGSP